MQPVTPQTYHILFYEFVADYLERRVPLRSAHLALAAEAHGRGELAIAGAYADPADGAALIFSTDDPAAVQRFVDADPYVKEGLVTRWTIRQWMVVIGGDPAS